MMAAGIAEKDLLSPRENGTCKWPENGPPLKQNRHGILASARNKIGLS